MGYWQNRLEIEKKGMLPYGNAGLIMVKWPKFELSIAFHI